MRLRGNINVSPAVEVRVVDAGWGMVVLDYRIGDGPWKRKDMPQGSTLLLNLNIDLTGDAAEDVVDAVVVEPEPAQITPRRRLLSRRSEGGKA